MKTFTVISDEFDEKKVESIDGKSAIRKAEKQLGFCLVNARAIDITDEDLYQEYEDFHHGGKRIGAGRNPSPDKGVQFRATIPPRLHRQLKDEAKHTGKSMSQITVWALEKWLSLCAK